MDMQLKQLKYFFFSDRVSSDTKSKEIQGSITKTSLKKLRLHRGVYECTYTGGIISNYVPTMLYLLLKIINPATRIGVSNLKYDIQKATLDKFVNNVKYLIDYMSSNYSIVIDKVEHHEDYVRHIYRAILSGTNSTFNISIESYNDYRDTGT